MAFKFTDYVDPGTYQHELSMPVPAKQELVDSTSAPDPVLAVLQNAENFDRGRFTVWIMQQSPKMQRAAIMRPPNRVYELKGKLCYVLAYAPDGHVVLRGIGDPDGASVHAYPDELTDVTNDVRRSKGLSAV